MKRALVLTLFVLLGTAFATSAQLQGEWDTWLKLDLNPFSVEDFYSFLDIQYVIGGLTLEAAGVIRNLGLEYVWFEAYGSLGAFSAWSLAYFRTYAGLGIDPAFRLSESGAEATIAGVDVYALFVVENLDPDVGTGFALGGIATAGDVRVGAEITSNLYPSLWRVFRYGFYAGVTDWTYTKCADNVWYPLWNIGDDWLSVCNPGCGLAFTYLTGIAEFPLCCADVYVALTLSYDGFGFLSVLAEDIDVGLDWLGIYGLGITYYGDAKYVDLWTQIVAGDVVCLKPYVSVDGGGTFIDGITLNALTLTCALGGCEVYWGHIFDPFMILYDWEYDGPYTLGPYVHRYGFGPLGVDLIASAGHGSSCAWSVWGPRFPNEVIGIQCDEDSCCGGLFSFGVSNFFSTEYHAPITGIFGWMGTYVELTVGVGSNVSLVGGMDVSSWQGVEFVTLGVEVAW